LQRRLKPWRSRFAFARLAGFLALAAPSSELITAGEIEIIKVGTITLVPMASLTRFLDRGSG
jgi:hypothetical protein